MSPSGANTIAISSGLAIGWDLASRKELDKELGRIMKKLKGNDSIKQVLLFGSLARGDLHMGRDIDLIVVKNTGKKFLDRLDEFYLDASEALDILVHTPEEFEGLKEKPFIKNALKEGRILYELDPHEEGMRWLHRARQDLDDASYNLEGKRSHLTCILSREAAENRP